jgi:hypothetical protein
MKIVMIAIIYVLFAKIAIAQQDLLSFDEHNKYIYYEVADMPGLSADTLHARSLYFLKKVYPRPQIKTTANTITGEGKFLTYGGVSVLRHETGEIAYHVNIEFKDQKYRYWLTAFVFTPYQRDRYGNFVPQQGIDIPLEDVDAKLEKKDAEAYLNETGTFCKEFGEKLKQLILKASKKEETTKKVVTDNW